VAVAAGGGGQQRKLWLAVGALSLVLIALLVGLALWVRPGLLGNTKPELQKQPTLSLSEFLAGSSQDWRVARLQENTAVLVVEFPNLAAQGAAMNRMAALLEKADAPRDRVLDDAALAALIARNGDNSQTFYQGHDYDGIGLSRFYALVDKQSQALTGEEARIRHVLVEHGLLTESPEGVRPVGAQAVITFTAIQKDDPATPVDETIDERRRESVLRHEISHGRFYTRPAYREHCRRFWRETLTEPQREGFRRYLATLGYDRHDDELMLNEAQAFLLHTPDTRAFNAQGVGIPEDVLAELRTRFWRTLPAEARENDVDTGAAAVKPAGPAAPAATSRP
jgi:hypothetical protein